MNCFLFTFSWYYCGDLTRYFVRGEDEKDASKKLLKYLNEEDAGVTSLDGHGSGYEVKILEEDVVLVHDD